MEDERESKWERKRRERERWNRNDVYFQHHFVTFDVDVVGDVVLSITPTTTLSYRNLGSSSQQTHTEKNGAKWTGIWPTILAGAM